MIKKLFENVPEWNVDGKHGKKARFLLQVSCPECNCVMRNHKNYIACENTKCDIFQIKYEPPTMHLIESNIP